MESESSNPKTGKKTVRQSNFELLRILAIMMIIVFHITTHCVKVQLEDQSLYKLGEYFNRAIFFKRLLLPQLFMTGGKIGNIIFVLIAGYFLINRKIQFFKQVKKLLSQLLFVIPLLVLGSFLYYRLFSDSFVGILNFNVFHSGYWFIGYYIGILAVAHYFLNAYLCHLEKSQYVAFLSIMFAISSIAYLRNSISEISSNLFTLFVGVFIYSLGGFIRLYNPLKNVRLFVLILTILASLTAVCINNYNNTIVLISYANRNGAQGIFQTLGAFSEYSIYCLLVGIALFEIFKRMKIRDNRVINYISSATFMTYLAHDNDFIRNVWRETNWIELCHNHLWKFLALYIKWLFLILLIGILFYSLYFWLSNLLKTEFLKRIILKNRD